MLGKQGGGAAAGGAETYTAQKIMRYINSWVFIREDLKNEISSPFRITSDSNKGVAEGARGGD